jgi:hypothetical protein
MPASGHQDHTTSPSASAPFVKSTNHVHRIPPRVRDDRDTPLEWDETARFIVLIWVRPETKCFCKQDWTAQIRLIRLNKFCYARKWRIGRAMTTSAISLVILAVPWLTARTSDRSAAMPDLCCGFAARRARKDNPEFRELTG